VRKDVGLPSVEIKLTNKLAGVFFNTGGKPNLQASNNNVSESHVWWKISGE